MTRRRAYVPSFDGLDSSTGASPSVTDLVRDRLGRTEIGSVALVDWPTLKDFADLLEGRDVRDPFLALLNFSTIISTLIFYDRVLFLDFENMAERAANLLGADSPLVGIPVLPPERDRRNARLFSRRSDPIPDAALALIRLCIKDFDEAERTQPDWYKALERRWRAVLPDLEWPSHTYDDTFNTARRIFNQSVFAEMHLFAMADNCRAEYDFDSITSWPFTIVINDVRTLFYSRMARAMSEGLKGEESSVRYTGGALRMPMATTLAQLSEACLDPSEAVQVEGWLDRQWRQDRPSESFAVRMPFWFEAVVSQARRPAELGEILFDYRRKAKRFRKRRTELEAALANRDLRATTRLAKALQGDTARLTEGVMARGGAAVDAVDVGMKAVLPLPVGPKTALSVLSAVVGRERADSIAIRVFHPELRAIHDLGRGAARLGNAVPAAFSLFDFPRAEASKPLRFLNRLGHVSVLG